MVQQKQRSWRRCSSERSLPRYRLPYFSCTEMWRFWWIKNRITSYNVCYTKLLRYPDIALYLRGDSGFACPELFELLETHGTSYAIRLKANDTLDRLAESLENELNEITSRNKVDYAVVYGEFRYAAATWGQDRRIVVKVEKPAGQITFMHTFIVTNMELKQEDIIHFYCNRGKMENFIKESKSGFDMDTMSSHSRITSYNVCYTKLLRH